MSETDRLDLATMMLTETARSTALKGTVQNLEGTATIEHQEASRHFQLATDAAGMFV